MPGPSPLELPIVGTAFALSVRRITEHARLRQLNPFARDLRSVTKASDTDALIDVLRLRDDVAELTGLTLADLAVAARHDPGLGRAGALHRKATRSGAAAALRQSVLALASELAERRATRNLPAPLLPPALETEPFGVRHLRSRLCDYLDSQSAARHSPLQWLATLRNLSTRGIRKEELSRSGLSEWLENRPTAAPVGAKQLREAIDFLALRLSIIAFGGHARAQLRFLPAGTRQFQQPRGIERHQKGQRRRARLYDPVFGYRVEAVERDSLWGTDRYWQALTFKGSVLRNAATGRSIFPSEDDAAARAQSHAARHYPKLHASGTWGRYAWTGGEGYREWLITLPCFRWSFYSSHFPLRNVLAHVRCDLREGEHGERVLLLQEVQSDWLQEMRRDLSGSGDGAEAERVAPFLNEWHALALKLMTLHAVHAGCDAIAWIRGEHQAERYDGLGQVGLGRLYDRELPAAANRMLKPFGLSCGTVDVFVPRNFHIRCLEDRYEVLDLGGRVLATVDSFTEARRFLPDGAHEELRAVHGFRLSVADRERIQQAGLFAWG